ncbi:MAG: hydrogenase maturation protease [bacterium]|nr:hydrogenase maturation protease [bacterium]
MSDTSATMLLIGYGNPGRLDDGLGPAVAKAIAGLDLPGVSVDSDYQLTVEDAGDVAKYDKVIFVDADTSGAEPFWVKRLLPSEGSLTFSTHSISPAGVLQLARDLFHSEPECWLMGIRGYEFNEFGEVLSDKAQANLAEAVAFLESAIRKGEIAAVRSGDGQGMKPTIEP